MPVLEPEDMSGKTVLETIDAVLFDVRAHPLTPDPGGLTTCSRHLRLLTHLVRLCGEEAAGLAARTDESSALAEAQVLAVATPFLAEALAHYARAHYPLVCLAQDPEAAPVTVQMGDYYFHREVPRALAAVHRMLTEARDMVAGDPADTPGPGAPAPSTAARPSTDPAPTVRGSARR
ncbi:hypothetical protein [Streptomyces sp. YIM 98790]|uniref:hypothetical protein n=1 Tax=Streptomyces sp. YIM 98790 TaxID=2689077 RepID=UPI00140E42B1|nr:hypothetical protein [Streptomyces sp. YIM 98790]